MHYVILCHMPMLYCSVEASCLVSNWKRLSAIWPNECACVLPMGVYLFPAACCIISHLHAGALGQGLLRVLAAVKHRAVRPGVPLAVLPARVRVYGMGVEMLTRRVAGVDMSTLNKFRWVTEVLPKRSKKVCWTSKRPLACLPVCLPMHLCLPACLGAHTHACCCCF